MPAVKNLSLALAPGDVLGVIGPSGAGKSTLARLLVGVWPSACGMVRLDGADIYRWNKDELGPSIGYLPQDIELFAGTVGENIARFGDVDPAKVVAAASAPACTSMILQLPKGYDTELGDGGAGLSGGQKQRIAPGPRHVRRPVAAGAGRAQLQPRRCRRAGAGRRHRRPAQVAARRWC